MYSTTGACFTQHFKPKILVRSMELTKILGLRCLVKRVPGYVFVVLRFRSYKFKIEINCIVFCYKTAINGSFCIMLCFVAGWHVVH